MLKDTEKQLIKAAIEARKSAYCPYSDYSVGAAVLTASGNIYTGCNIENASLSLTCCAERTAIFKAISCGETKILAVCVAAKSAKPCGACRQVMAEFMGKNAAVIMVNLKNNRPSGIIRKKISGLLPTAFNPSEAGL